MAKGRAVAGWKLVNGKVATAPYGDVSRQTSAALQKEAADVERFLAP
jgi:hypothetical protein